MLNTVTSLIRIKNVAATALIVAALCAVAFSAISMHPQDDAQAQATAGITITPMTINTVEGATSASDTPPLQTFTVVLDDKPTGNFVQVDIRPSDLSLATVEVTGDSTLNRILDLNQNQIGVYLRFFPSSPNAWNEPQSVTVTPHANDANGVDEETTLDVRVNDLLTADTRYTDLDDQSVTVNIADNDQGITANIDSGSPTGDCSSVGNEISDSDLFEVDEGDNVGENYCVKLAAAPRAVADGETAEAITVTITSDNPDVTFDTDRGTAGNQNTLTFKGDVGSTEGSWNTYVPVQVFVAHDVDDPPIPDEETATLSHAATGGGYSLDADDSKAQTTVTLRDDDPGIAITGMTEGGLVLEGEPSQHATQHFRVSLTTQDTTTSEVTVTITEVIAAGASSQLTPNTLQFDNGQATFSSNIGITRTVDFTPADDSATDTNHEDSPLQLKITASDGTEKSAGGYGTVADPTEVLVDLTIVDDERAPGVTIEPTTLNIDEGKSKTYNVYLDSAPTADPSSAGVQINMAIKDNKGGIFVDGDASTAGNQQTIEFRSGNPGATDSWNRWFIPRMVTVIAATDADMSDDMEIMIEHTITVLAGETKYADVTKGLDDVTVNVTDTTTKAPTPAGGYGQVDIRSVSPSVKGVTVSAGDTVRLMVNVYALENNLLQKLADRVGFDWTVNGVAIPDTGGNGNDEISYTAPSSPGTYIVKATLMGNECLYTGTGDDYGKNCEAEFEIKVRRSAPAAEPTAVPVNPLGEIPDIISGNDGKQYEVFTPEEGGTFDGDSHSITAGSGIVPSGEYIGVRMDGAGSASNAGMTAHRYTLVGDAYMISVADSAGEAINSYALNGAAKVCLPLPAEARSNISDIALVVKLSDGSLQVLSGTVRIAGASGPDVCGHVSSIPATVAVGTAGAPAAFTPTPEPTSTPEPPETGGTAPTNGAPLALILLLGIATAAIGTFLLAGRRATR